MMYHTAKLFSDMGKNVLIDGILVERKQIRPHYQQLLEIMKDSPLDIIQRGDRYETQSEEQAALMAKEIRYSMKVDTSLLTPEECAEKIINTLINP